MYKREFPEFTCAICKKKAAQAQIITSDGSKMCPGCYTDSKKKEAENQEKGE